MIIRYASQSRLHAMDDCSRINKTHNGSVRDCSVLVLLENYWMDNVYFLCAVYSLRI